MEKTRYYILDIIRGITILSMILYHFIWDLNYLYGFRMEWYQTDVGYLWQQSICWVFIFLSGFCVNLGSRPFRRSAMIFACGLLITVVTMIFLPQERVLFGVLTLLGSAGLLTAAGHRLLRDRITEKYAGIMAAGTFFAFLVFKNVFYGYLGFRNGWQVELPDFWYRNLLTAYLGFPPDDFYSGDYFPMIPWFLLFLSGYFMFRLNFIQKNMKRLTILGIRNRPLEWAGKRALIIYILHQPVLLATTYFADLFFWNV